MQHEILNRGSQEPVIAHMDFYLNSKFYINQNTCYTSTNSSLKLDIYNKAAIYILERNLYFKLLLPSWMAGTAVRHNFERGSPKDHFCQVWFNLVQRRRFKGEKIKGKRHGLNKFAWKFKWR